LDRKWNVGTVSPTMNHTMNVDGIGSVEITFSERGAGQAVLLLHGGAGPLSVVPWAELLGRSKPARVITPTHPGFMGTPRPEALKDIQGLARVYAALIRDLAPEGATVIGNSIGGWIAAELALFVPALVKKLVLVDAVGIELPGHPVADVFTLSLDELSQLSYHDPQRFRIDLSKLPPEVKAAFGGNRAALKVYASNPMDPALRPRLAAVSRPTLVVWGEADKVADGDYGRAFANAIPNSRFQLLAGTGHVPQIETPELLAETIWPFIA
jgi:pimeloyl-ACP methyl ester carboxylesterase